MKKHLLIALLSIATACTTSSKLVTSSTPIRRFEYPLVAESNASYDQVWSKLVDHIATKGFPIAHLDKENGLFISQRMTQVPYMFENTNGNSDSASLIVLPRIRQQQKGNEGVKSSRLIFPDSISIVFNVRIRSNGRGGTFVNVNIPTIEVGGGHYIQKQLIRGDTVIIKTPVAVKRTDWGSALSSGRLERSIIQAVKDGKVSQYSK